MHFTQAIDDYWDEDFDENKNCVREEKMTQLQRQTEPGRCASAARSGNILSPFFIVEVLVKLPPQDQSKYSGKIVRRN